MILGVETSGKLCSIAWYENNNILLEYNIEQPQAHSALLANLFKTGMQFLKRSAHDITFAAIAAGPGSYTGLRIGMSFIKGLCYGLDIPMVGVSNFSVLALQAPTNSNKFYTLINAYKGRYYFALFENGKDDIKENGFIDSERIHEIINQDIGVICDSSININSLNSNLKKINWLLNGQFNASNLCKAAKKKFDDNGSDDLENFEPMYTQTFAGVL